MAGRHMLAQQLIQHDVSDNIMGRFLGALARPRGDLGAASFSLMGLRMSEQLYVSNGAGSF